MKPEMLVEIESDLDLYRVYQKWNGIQSVK